MPNLLLSGPAGAGKTEEARRLLAEMPEGVVLDFQQLYAALLLIFRDPETRRYPEREATRAYALSMAEYVRKAGIAGARAQELEIIATNSDGSPARREYLLGLLGPGATERVLDPGVETVTARLSNASGYLSEGCRDAINRWYGRV